MLRLYLYMLIMSNDWLENSRLSIQTCTVLLFGHCNLPRPNKGNCELVSHHFIRVLSHQCHHSAIIIHSTISFFCSIPQLLVVDSNCQRVLIIRLAPMYHCLKFNKTMMGYIFLKKALKPGDTCS